MLYQLSYSRVTQNLLKLPVLYGLGKDNLLGITTKHHMVERTGVVDSWTSCHRLMMSHNNNHNKESLTPLSGLLPVDTVYDFLIWLVVGNQFLQESTNHLYIPILCCDLQYLDLGL